MLVLPHQPHTGKLQLGRGGSLVPNIYRLSLTAVLCSSMKSCYHSTKPMIGPKRLIERAMKRGVSSVAEKGHFVVYSAEGKRFMVPLVYLKSDILRELLKMSEDEFGLRGDGPIVLPCNAAFLEYALTILQGSKDVERELFSSLLNRHCLTSALLLEGNHRQLVASGF